MQSIRDTGTADGDPNAPILLDQDDDGIKIATGWIPAGEAKGFDLYVNNHLQSLNNFTDEERELIQSMLPAVRDWYVQTGAGGMVATDTLNRGAFMLGGSDSGSDRDALAGGSQHGDARVHRDDSTHLYVNVGAGHLVIDRNNNDYIHTSNGNATNDSDWRAAA